MNGILSSEPTAEEFEEFREFLQQGLAEMARLFAPMAEGQKEIDCLATPSQANLSEARAIFEQNELAFSIQQIYYEAQRLNDEIRHFREDNERREKDAARERDNLILRLENQLLRAERGLPPLKADDAGD